MLSHLGEQDVVAFTGSADTAATLRTTPAVLNLSVPLNVEADSLNAAVLGPDVQPDTATLNGKSPTGMVSVTVRLSGSMRNTSRYAAMQKRRFGKHPAYNPVM